MKRAVLLLTILSATLLVACGGDDDTASLQPASTVSSERTATAVATAAKADLLGVGESAVLNNDVKVTVKAIALAPELLEAGRPRQPSGGETFALVTLRIDNPDEADHSVDVSISCENTKSGGWYVYNAPSALKQPVPTKSFTEGDMLLGVPADCTGGRVLVRATGAFTQADPQKSATWALK